MALNSTVTKDNENSKFVESPTRTGQAAVEVVVSNPMPIEIDGEVNVIADIEQSTTPVIYNVSAPTANTEVSRALTTGTKKFLIRVRNSDARLQMAFTSTESSTKFISIPSGANFSAEGLNLTGIVLYFQTDKASQTVEILEWS